MPNRIPGDPGAQQVAGPGSYVLFLEVAAAQEFVVGRLGRCRLAPGLYAYAGSARGPGGLAARLGRHLRRAKRLRWHIDYLTTALSVTHVYAVPGREPRECQWAQRLAALPGAATPLRGFGSSDCRAGCPAHLIRLPDGLSPVAVEELLQA